MAITNDDLARMLGHWLTTLQSETPYLGSDYGAPGEAGAPHSPAVRQRRTCVHGKGHRRPDTGRGLHADGVSSRRPSSEMPHGYLAGYEALALHRHQLDADRMAVAIHTLKRSRLVFAWRPALSGRRAMAGSKPCHRSAANWREDLIAR